MKIREFYLLCILASFTLILASCAPTNIPTKITTTSPPPSTPTPTIQPTQTVFPTPTTLPIIENGHPSLEDAIPFGESGTLGLFSLSINRLIRPATEEILAASSGNLPPEKGMEYVLVDLIEECALPIYNECFIRVSDMRLIGSAGIERRPKNITGIPFMMPNRHIFGGTTAYGYIAFIVDKTEQGLVFYYDSENEGTLYLATE